MFWVENYPLEQDYGFGNINICFLLKTASLNRIMGLGISISFWGSKLPASTEFQYLFRLKT